MFHNLKNELGEEEFKKLILQTDSDGYTGNIFVPNKDSFGPIISMPLNSVSLPFLWAYEINNYLALHRASNSGSYDLAVGLIKNGADVNAKTDDGWIPLHSGNAFALLNVALNSARN